MATEKEKLDTDQHFYGSVLVGHVGSHNQNFQPRISVKNIPILNFTVCCEYRIKQWITIFCKGNLAIHASKVLKKGLLVRLEGMNITAPRDRYVEQNDKSLLAIAVPEPRFELLKEIEILQSSSTKQPAVNTPASPNSPVIKRAQFVNKTGAPTWSPSPNTGVVEQPNNYFEPPEAFNAPPGPPDEAYPEHYINVADLDSYDF